MNQRCAIGFAPLRRSTVSRGKHNHNHMHTHMHLTTHTATITTIRLRASFACRNGSSDNEMGREARSNSGNHVWRNARPARGNASRTASTLSGEERERPLGVKQP
jgi:hypothetical protein